VLPATAVQNEARALPVNPDILTQERVAAYQVALERMHFSCGFIDGDLGMRCHRMLRAFQASRDLPVTGELDPATREAVGEPGEPFFSYIVTAHDMNSIVPPPKTWEEKSKVAYLGYSEPWEMLAEKFHCTRDYLKMLNRDLTDIAEGAEVIGPKVFPASPLPKIASIRVLLGDTSIQGIDASNRIVAHFPCSIAKNKNKRPNGILTVKNVVPDPNYTFDPAVLFEAAQAEHITHKLVIPPGPRDPVGIAWIGLSLPGYGMHGTPEPENISRTQSHGCFRLANWNAEKMLKMASVGMSVDVVP
jgi:lipoprotein-anchoring transpeptidase ErfK/SrfK